MSQTLVEKAGDRITQSIHDASRVTAEAATEAADAVAEGVKVAKRAAKQGCQAAEDFVHDSTHCIRCNPLAAVAVTLVAGITFGLLAGLLIRRR